MILSNMKTCHLFILSAAALLLSQAASGRSHIPDNLEYAYNHTLEFTSGVSGMPYTLTGDGKNAMGMAGGGNLTFRYTGFFNKHWGLFVSIFSDVVSADENNFFTVANRADGNRYKYTTGRYYYNTNLDNCLGGGLVGVTYRYDFGNASVRPRIGIGASSFSYSISPYERFNRTDNGELPVRITYSPVTPQKDFIISESSYTGGDTAFTCYAGCQILYTFRNTFFISAELSMKTFWIPDMGLEKRTYKGESAYNPDNWAEAVYQYGYKDNYIYGDSYTATEARLPWMMLNASIGIGWNFGRSRSRK